MILTANFCENSNAEDVFKFVKKAAFKVFSNVSKRPC